MKVQPLFSTCIFKNKMHNYAWTLIIWWKRKIFIYFMNCYWIKNLLSTAIQNKKYLVVFDKHKNNSLHVYYLISCIIFGLFIFFIFFMQNWIVRYICKYFFQHVLKFLSIIYIFKSFKNFMCFIFSLKDISSLTIYRISMKKMIELDYICKHILSCYSVLTSWSILMLRID